MSAANVGITPGWEFSPRALKLGNEAVGAYVRLALWASTYDTDGLVPSTVVVAICGQSGEAVTDMLATGVLAFDDDRWRLLDWEAV